MLKQMRLSRENWDDLPRVLDEIHDKYFDVDKVRYDKKTHIFRLPFSAAKWGPYDRFLDVSDVNKCFIEDTEQIGVYCLNTLVLESNASTIRILCDVPLVIRLDVGPGFAVLVH